MIISHKYKFIFVKVHKTASTSVEIALSKYCGPQDTITHIMPSDEKIRQELGYPGPQHVEVPLSQYKATDYLRVLKHRKPMRFNNHSSAAFIQEHVKPEFWKSYYTFCFDRNPWDKIISWYYWVNKLEPRPSISEFIRSEAVQYLGGFNSYSKNAEVIVDDVFKFEELEYAMETIGKQIGIDEKLLLPRTKIKERKDRRPYQEILSEEDIAFIAQQRAEEIALHGYTQEKSCL